MSTIVPIDDNQPTTIQSINPVLDRCADYGVIGVTQILHQLIGPWFYTDPLIALSLGALVLYLDRCDIVTENAVRIKRRTFQSRPASTVADLNKSNPGSVRLCVCVSVCLYKYKYIYIDLY